MTSMANAVQSVLEAPPRSFTKAEAQELLKRYGVLNQDNTVSEEFKDIFKKKETENARN